MTRRAPRRRLRVGLAVLLASLALPGCIAYRSGSDSARVPQRLDGPKKSISVLIRANGTYRGADRQLPEYILSQWKQAVLDAYRESGLFSEVREGIGRGTDLQASVRIDNTVFASRGFSFLSGVSFLVIPGKSRDTFQIQTTLTNQAGAVLAILKSAETVTTWYQILLAPLAVFFSRDAVVSDTLYDLTLDTAAQAQRKGLL